MAFCLPSNRQKDCELAISVSTMESCLVHRDMAEIYGFLHLKKGFCRGEFSKHNRAIGGSFLREIKCGSRRISHINGCFFSSEHHQREHFFQQASAVMDICQETFASSFRDVTKCLGKRTAMQSPENAD